MDEHTDRQAPPPTASEAHVEGARRMPAVGAWVTTQGAGRNTPRAHHPHATFINPADEVVPSNAPQDPRHKPPLRAPLQHTMRTPGDGGSLIAGVADAHVRLRRLWIAK